MKIPLLLLALATPLIKTANAAPTSKTPPASTKPSIKPAPQKAPATISPIKADSLAIPTFNTIPSEFTFVGTQKDLLGMVQTFAQGASIAGAKPVSPNMEGAARLFTDADLLAMLKNIHVLTARSLSFRSRGDEAYDRDLKALAPPATKTTTPSVLEQLGGGDKLYDVEQGKLEEARKFYTEAFTKQGGKPQLTLQSNKTSVAVYAFEAPQSFALLTRGPSRVIVVRADGLPQLAVIGRLFRQLMSS